MSLTYHSVTAPWPTFTDGSPVTRDEELGPVRARIHALDIDALDQICDVTHGGSLEDVYAGHPADVRADPHAAAALEQAIADGNEDHAAVIAAAAALRRDLLDGIADLVARPQQYARRFDGRRWWVTAGGSTFGDSPSGAFDTLVLLAASGVTLDPVDAEPGPGTAARPDFLDAPAVAAAATVLDGLAATVLAALDTAGVTAAAREAAVAALEQARLDVFGAARTIRRTMTAVTEQRQRD